MSNLARYNLFLAQRAKVLAVLLTSLTLGIGVAHAIPEGFRNVPVISPAQGDEGVAVGANDPESLIACFGDDV
jgi:hypothetical protein